MPLHFAVCELYHPRIHGISPNPPKNITQHYIVREILSLEEVLQNEHQEMISTLKITYMRIRRTLTSHPVLTNYRAIIREPDYIKLDIIQSDEIAGDDGYTWTIGYLKTHYIKIIQRKWKTYYKKLQNTIRARKHPRSLQYREITGKWPC